MCLFFLIATFSYTGKSQTTHAGTQASTASAQNTNTSSVTEDFPQVAEFLVEGNLVMAVTQKHGVARINPPEAARFSLKTNEIYTVVKRELSEHTRWISVTSDSKSGERVIVNPGSCITNLPVGTRFKVADDYQLLDEFFENLKVDIL